MVFDVSRKAWMRRAGSFLVTVFFAVVTAVGVFFMNYYASAAALTTLGVQLQEDLIQNVKVTLDARFDPMVRYLKQGVEYAAAHNLDLDSWEGGVKEFRRYQESFINSFFGDQRCCTCLYSNFEIYDPETNPEQLQGPKPMLNCMVVNNDGSTCALWSREPGHPKSNLSMQCYDEETKRLTGDELNLGFVPLTIAYKSTFFDVCNSIEEEGKIIFTEVFPAVVELEACIPTFGPPYGFGNRGSSGTKPKRGFLIVGVKLGWISEYLNTLALKNGFMMLVERSSDKLVAASSPDIMNLAEGEDGTYSVITAQDSPSSKVRELSDLVLEMKGSWQTMPEFHEAVSLWGKTQYLYVFDIRVQTANWVGVLTIPEESILEEIQEKRVGTIGFSIALAIAANLGASFLSSFVAPAIKRLVRGDEGQDEGRRSSLGEETGQSGAVGEKTEQADVTVQVLNKSTVV